MSGRRVRQVCTLKKLLFMKLNLYKPTLIFQKELPCMKFFWSFSRKKRTEKCDTKTNLLRYFLFNLLIGFLEQIIHKENNGDACNDHKDRPEL